MTAEREAMTLEQVRDEMRAYARGVGTLLTRGECAQVADPIDAHLSRAAEPVAWPKHRASVPYPNGGSEARLVGFVITPEHPWYGTGLSSPLFALEKALGETHPPEPARDANNKPWTDGEKAHMQAAAELVAERDRLRALINSPEVDAFLRGTHIEAVHQVERWGTSHDRAKRPADWFWLVGYLAGKALHAATEGNVEKAKHHCISSAAALYNWHSAIAGNDVRMCPGRSDLAEMIEAQFPNETAGAAMAQESGNAD